MHKTFDPSKRKKLNNPERLKWIPPDILWKFISYYNPKEIIDIGAGTGYFTNEISRYTPQSIIHALDIEPLMIEEMKNSLSNKNIKPQLITNDKYAFSDNSIDLVWIINVYHEFTHPLVILKKIHQVLKPGGKILIVDWAKLPNSIEHGPPPAHRIRMEEVIENITTLKYININYTREFTYHYAIVAQKK